MAIYKIDDAKKTITKMPLDAIKDAAGMFTVKKEKILDESEIFELPTGYKMVVMDLSKGMKQMEEMEQKWKTAEDQMKGLQGKSTEELLQMLKNK